MKKMKALKADEVDEIFRRACAMRAPSSIRAVGSFKLLGDLQVCGYEPGEALYFCGARQRDHILPQGTAVSVSLLLGDEIISMETILLNPLCLDESDKYLPPIIRVGWPKPCLEIRQRGDIRVATPELPPLEATLEHRERQYPAKLMNLTETGMGIGLDERLYLDLHAQVEVHTELPGGIPLCGVGSVRHLEWLDEDPSPTRLGLVLGCMTEQARESLRRFIQARRTDKSEKLRMSQH